MNSKEIAKIVGVSRSTVSRVINNYPDIASSTREKVLKAIKEYNYYPNSSARRLVGMKNSTLGVFVVDIKDNEKPHHVIENNEDLLYGNSYFSPFINAFIDQANKIQYYVLVSTIYSSDELWKIQSAVCEKRIDGGVIIGSNEEQYEKILSVIDKNFILAAIDINVTRQNKNKAIYINLNNSEGASKAANYLIELGHRNIGIITGDVNKLSGSIRFNSFKKVLTEKGIELNPDCISYGDFTESSGYIGMKKILKLKRKPTAVFTSNDTMAIGAYKAIAESGLSIPDDISIIGFDNTQISQYMFPPLTSVNVSLPEAAKYSVNSLKRSIEKKELIPEVKMVDTTIIKRGSCKSIN